MSLKWGDERPSMLVEEPVRFDEWRSTAFRFDGPRQTGLYLMPNGEWRGVVRGHAGPIWAFLAVVFAAGWTTGVVSFVVAVALLASR